MNSTIHSKAQIGMIGLGVMGQNLTLNIERNGYRIAVFERELPVLEKFIRQVEGKQIIGTRSPEEFVLSLERPRKIILLVKAGDPVDWTINLINPALDTGDIIIDCGNSHFKDTERRAQGKNSGRPLFQCAYIASAQTPTALNAVIASS